MQARAESIGGIIKRIGCRKFRFRNVLSLQDYFNTEKEYGGFVTVINLDSGQYFQINTDNERYALLSSGEELDYLNGFKGQHAINAAAKNYVR